MKFLKKLAMAATVAAVASLGARAMALTYEQAVQLVKTERLSQNQDCDSVNFYVAETDTIINNYCCTISESIPTQWAGVSDKILVFVNEQPHKCWNHLCSYYYLPATVTDINNVPIIKYEGVMPPSRVNLTPVDINVASPIRAICNTALLHNPAIPSPLMSLPISLGNQHQVLIMAAGINDASQFTKRWNESALLYRTLTQVYNIPRQNIHLFMGLDDSDNLMVDSNNDTIPMLRDLDGDGVIEDIQSLGYGQLDDFRDYVADSLASAGVDHLFTFYTGNLWGYDPYNFMADFIPMMAEGLDVMDFEATVHRCGAAYNTILCCSKDADYVTERFNGYENCILIAANCYNYYAEFGENTGDPHEYYRHWISAIAGQDFESGSFVDADNDHDGYITMSEADTYASVMQVGNTSFMRSRPTCIDGQVSFGHIELYKGLHICINGWESPDVWVRNQNDGLAEQEQDALRIIQSNPYKHVYVRVTNQSLEDYNGSGVYLRLFWKKPVLGIGNSSLFSSSDYADKRGHIATIPLNQSIASGHAAIVSCQWELPEELVSFAQANHNVLPVVVMAQLSRDTTLSAPDDIVATNGLLRVNVKSGTLVRQNSSGALPVHLQYVNRIPVYYRPSPYMINVTSLEQTGMSRVFARDSMTITLSPSVAVNAAVQGLISPAVANSATFNVSGPGAIKGLSEINALDSMAISIVSNAVANNTPASSDKLAFRVYNHREVLQNESGSGVPTPYGTMPIEFFVDADSPFAPPVIRASANSDNSVDLQATQVDGTSSCSWHNQSELLGEGSTLHLGADEARGIVQLIAIDTEAGRVGTASIDLDDAVIVCGACFTDGGNDLTLALARAATQDLIVNAVYAQTGRLVATGRIEAGESGLHLDSSSWIKGSYLLSVMKEGTVVGTFQLLKP